MIRPLPLPSRAFRACNEQGGDVNKSLVTGLMIGAVVPLGATAFAGLKMMHKSPEYADVLKVTPLT